MEVLAIAGVLGVGGLLVGYLVSGRVRLGTAIVHAVWDVLDALGTVVGVVADLLD